MEDAENEYRSIILSENAKKTVSPIKCVFCYSKQQLYYYEKKLSIKPLFWNKNVQRAKETKAFAGYFDLNITLDNIETTILSCYRKYINDTGREPDVEELKTMVQLKRGIKDKMAQKYVEGAAAVRINVSYYHLAYPDTKEGTVIEDAKKEANYFTGLFQAGLMPSPKWLAVDLEKMSNGWDTPLNKTDYLKWLQVFLSQIYSNTGIVCWIYSNKSYLERHLPGNHGLGTIPLWIANYNHVSTPPLPNGWSSYYL